MSEREITECIAAIGRRLPTDLIVSAGVLDSMYYLLTGWSEELALACQLMSLLPGEPANAVAILWQTAVEIGAPVAGVPAAPIPVVNVAA